MNDTSAAELQAWLWTLLFLNPFLILKVTIFYNNINILSV